ncbi:MAG TPA: hypothetical protein VL461_11480 [Dictyobacter sp.]|jgi:C4-dicarboxylate transporter/malic acid transport protein|nr:hypothetical protein [Dictyobacter sp.]
MSDSETGNIDIQPTDRQRPVFMRWFSVVGHWIEMGVEQIHPGWFTCVMGTGILALCIMNLPFSHFALSFVSQSLWLADVCILISLLLLWIFHGIRFPHRLRESLHHPARAQQWGAPPMACFTISTGFMVIGDDVFDTSLCLLGSQILWCVGVIGSIFAVLIVPYLMFTRHELSIETTYGNWLMPIVPPIGAAVPGSLLAVHLPAMFHSDALIVSYVLWGGGLALAAIIIVLFYTRLVYHKVPAGELVPTMWLVIGPLGQSVTGLNALGDAANVIWPKFGDTLEDVALVYGIPAWGLGVYWLFMAALVTFRAARVHLPFSLTWWAFIYPVGVLTTGTYALYRHTHAMIFGVSGVLLACLLVCLWCIVVSRTLRHLFGHLSVSARVKLDLLAARQLTTSSPHA